LLLNESYANGGKYYLIVSGLGKVPIGKMKLSVKVFHHQSRFIYFGGSDKVTYAVSGSHLDQEGIVGQSKSGF
jgi:hypothetical protein